MMNQSANIMVRTELLGAANYKPLPIVITKAAGVWVEDPEGKRYMDMLSSYSALNQGHCHPKIIQALKMQADKVTLTSRAFHNDQLCILYEKLAALTQKNMFLPMNTGAEAVETALKATRRWAYDHKHIPADKAEIIVCEEIFMGAPLPLPPCLPTPNTKGGLAPLLPASK